MGEHGVTHIITVPYFAGTLIIMILGDREDLFVTHLIVVSKPKFQQFNIFISFRGCLSEFVVSSQSVFA